VKNTQFLKISRFTTDANIFLIIHFKNNAEIPLHHSLQVLTNLYKELAQNLMGDNISEIHDLTPGGAGLSGLLIFVNSAGLRAVESV
jgi:hypothetical protein